MAQSLSVSTENMSSSSLLLPHSDSSDSEQSASTPSPYRLNLSDNLRVTSTPYFLRSPVSPFNDFDQVSLVEEKTFCTPPAHERNLLSSRCDLSFSPIGRNNVPSPCAVDHMAETGLWVFGYGSLCWHQGFDYSESLTGYVKGFTRRFWQGNATHRGTEKQPGRVATLIEDREGTVWGQAFQVQGDAALPYLNNRECELGGYRTTLTTFYPRDQATSPFPAVLYIATPSNEHWLGEGSMDAIADQIVSSSGNSGHNVEYLLRLAEFLRTTTPEAKDEHIFTLESLVRQRITQRQLCLKTLMGENSDRPRMEVAAQVHPVVPVEAVAVSPSQYSTRVPSKKLRCVNI